MSVPFINRLIELGIGKEGTRGAGVAATFWVPKVSFDHDVKVDRAVSAASFGNISAESTGYVTEEFAMGKLESEIRDKSFGLFLLSLLGASSPAASGGAYKHTFTLQNDNAHQSLCFSYKDSISSLLFKLVMIDEMTIEVAAGEIAKFAASFQSKTAVDTSALTAAYVQENRFTSKHASLKVAASTGALAAASATSIKKFSLTISKNLVRTSVLGSVEPEDILNTAFKITGRIELDYKNRTMRDYMLGGTIRAMRFQLLDSARTIGTSANPTFLIDLPKVQFYEWERAGGLDDIVGEVINFTAFYDAVNNQVWSDCYLINETASY